jgi:hypothetical protein
MEFVIHIVHEREISYQGKNKQTPWPESTSELYRPSDLRLSAKLVPTFADRGVLRSQHGESPTAVITVFLTWSPYDFFQVRYKA